MNEAYAVRECVTRVVPSPFLGKSQIVQALVDQNSQLEVDSLSNRQPVKFVADVAVGASVMNIY